MKKRKRVEEVRLALLIGDCLFPVRCPVCDRPVPFHRRKEGICTECIKKLPVINGNRCYKCGRQLWKAQKEWCEDCLKRGRVHLYESGWALCSYDDLLRESVYRLKYGGRREYAKTYGRLMGRQFKELLKRIGVEGIVPVPLHAKREYERGYNQATVLAKALGEATGIPVYEQYVVRVRNTPPLKSLTALQRQNNLKKAFKIGRNDVKLRVTIVIDDIYTTGSTIDAVSEVLIEAGVLRVYFMTLAIGEDI